VVVYVDAPRRIAGPLLKTFEEQSGITVQPRYRQQLGEEFEATLLSEAAAGRVDLVWAESPVGVCGLLEAGLAQPFRPLGARPVLRLYRDQDYRWIGFAANPRVILYNSDLVERGRAPASIHDMVRGEWAGKGVLPRPHRGGAAYQAASLYAVWGAERAREFFDRVLRNGTRIVEDDAAARRLIASGGAAWGFVGLDEAICAKREAEPVQIVYPDRVSSPGTAMPPQLAMLVRSAPNPDQAKGLFGWMFTPEAGFVFGTHDCAMIALIPDAPKHEWVPALSTFNILPVDGGAVCKAWGEQAAYLEAWGRGAAQPAAPGAPTPDRPAAIPAGATAR
jgi:iron(III) transport system substrate-binding protein